MKVEAIANKTAGAIAKFGTFFLFGFLVLPILALIMSSSRGDVVQGLKHPLFFPSFWLSLKTTVYSLLVIAVTGTPLAWWLAHSKSRQTGIVSVLIDLPIVVPPAVIGIALLQTFGRKGLF